MSENAMHIFGRNFHNYEFNNVEYSADVMLNNPRYEFNDFGCSSPFLFPTVPNFLPTTSRTEDDQTHTNLDHLYILRRGSEYTTKNARKWPFSIERISSEQKTGKKSGFLISDGTAGNACEIPQTITVSWSGWILVFLCLY